MPISRSFKAGAPARSQRSFLMREEQRALAGWLQRKSQLKTESEPPPHWFQTTFDSKLPGPRWCAQHALVHVPFAECRFVGYAMLRSAIKINLAAAHILIFARNNWNWCRVGVSTLAHRTYSAGERS